MTLEQTGLTPEVAGKVPEPGVEIPVAPKTPTVEELNKELQDAKGKTAEAEQRYKVAQGLLKQKDTRVKELEGRWQKLEDKVENLTYAIAKTQGKSEDTLTDDLGQKPPDFRKELDNLALRREAERVGESFRQRVEDIGLTPRDANYWIMQNLVRTDLKGAEDLIEELETEYQKKQESPPVIEPPKVEPLKELSDEDKDREYLERHGMLPTSTGAPSAGGSRSFTIAQIDKMSYEEYKANKEAIDTAQREGRITE